MKKYKQTFVSLLVLFLVSSFTIPANGFMTAPATAVSEKTQTTVLFKTNKEFALGEPNYGRVLSTGVMTFYGVGDIYISIYINDLDFTNQLKLYVDGKFHSYVNTPNDDLQWKTIHLIKNRDGDFITTSFTEHIFEFRLPNGNDWMKIKKIEVTTDETNVYYEFAPPTRYDLGPPSYGRHQCTPLETFTGGGHTMIAADINDIDFETNFYIEVDGQRHYISPKINGKFVANGRWTISFPMELNPINQNPSDWAKHSIRACLSNTGDWVNLYSLQVIELNYGQIENFDLDMKAFNDVSFGFYSNYDYDGNLVYDDIIFTLTGETPVNDNGVLQSTQFGDNFWHFSLSAQITDNLHDHVYTYTNGDQFRTNVIKGLAIYVTVYDQNGIARSPVNDYDISYSKTSYSAAQTSSNEDQMQKFAMAGMDFAASQAKIPISPSTLLKYVDQLTNGGDTTYEKGQANGDWIYWKLDMNELNHNNPNHKDVAINIKFAPDIPSNVNVEGIWRMRIIYKVYAAQLDDIGALEQYSYIQQFQDEVNYFFEPSLA